MKSDSTALPAFVSGASANAGAKPASAARAEGGADDSFARLMRRNEAREAAEKPGNGAASAPREKPVRQGPNESRDAVSRRESRQEARDARKPALSSSDTAASDTAAETTAIAATAQATAQADADTDDNPLPLDWPPAGLILPNLLLEPLSAPPAANFAATGDALLGGAARPGLPTWMASALGTAAAPAATTTADGNPLANVLPTGDSTSTSSSAAASANLGNDGKLSLPSLASSLTHGALALATTATPAEAAVVLPAGLALFKDALEGVSGGKRDDAAAAATFALAGTAAPSDNGLARTATVNPLTSLTPDVNTDQFGETLGTQLTYMANEKIGHAHIRVSPNDLGTIEVSLKLDGDRVHADFSSPQADVRQALEQSLPKLRDLLSAHGFQLAQADVGHRQSNPQSSSAQGFAGRGGGGDAASAGNDAAAQAPVVRVTRGLVDAYA